MANEVPKPLIEHALERRVAESWPVSEWADTHVVLAVSGGADSVAMLRAMAALKSRHGGRGELHVAHLNHMMRGKESDADEAWLKSLCGKLNVRLEAEKADVSAIAIQQGDGWEAAARSVRYEFLKATAERIGARFVVTGHTANDQVETVLHRILRGTGIDGLAGMAKVRPLSGSVALVRPMLEVERGDLLSYLATIGQDYRSDSTNEDTRWTRNRLRHQLLPQLREHHNPQVDTALMRLAAQASELRDFVSEIAVELGEDCATATNTRVDIDCRKLVGQPSIVIREVFRHAWKRAGWPEQSMGFEQWRQLASLAAGSDRDAINLPGGWRARREGDLVIFELVAARR